MENKIQKKDKRTEPKPEPENIIEPDEVMMEGVLPEPTRFIWKQFHNTKMAKPQRIPPINITEQKSYIQIKKSSKETKYRSNTALVNK